MWDQQVVLPEFYGIIANKKVVDIAEQLCKSEEIIASAVYRMRPKFLMYDHSQSKRLPRYPTYSIEELVTAHFSKLALNSFLSISWEERRGCTWVSKVVLAKK
eukprot:Phypoly_transcript_20150.p1 GENE.Phypoly_transcript_20150~~Phypoly_transcript_20150.p1  ORF type:complete len:103 (+),score=12.23 Phypoly_transcript_20150:275-583(+)